MKAEIICVGTELLLGEVIDTNSAYIAKIMNNLGINIFRKTVVGDNLHRIKTAVEEALQRADLIIISGGIGPTEDDVTREAISEVFQKKLVLSDDILEGIKKRFSHYRIPEAAILKQSTIPENAKIIPNPVGSAPGIIVEEMNKIVIVLPGVPEELTAMTAQVASYLSNKVLAQKTVIKSLTLKVFGLGESQVDEKIAPLMAMANPTVALLAKKGEVHIRITAKFSLVKAKHEIKKLEKIIRERIGDYIFATDDETMEEVVGKLLISRGLKISVAESCSGGLLAHRLTNIPGISASFLAGIVSYSNEAKSNFLGIPPELIDEKGAVSPEVASEMARRLKNLTKSDISIGITGIAGPGGGSLEKPVGLLYIALGAKDRDVCQMHRFSGTRDMIKWRTSQAALDLIRRFILNIL